MLYTGVDYHREFSYVTTMNEKGDIVAQKKLRRLLPNYGLKSYRFHHEEVKAIVEAIK